jgi:Tfp pilus assembly protein PilF
MPELQTLSAWLTSVLNLGVGFLFVLGIALFAAFIVAVHAEEAKGAELGAPSIAERREAINLTLRAANLLDEGQEAEARMALKKAIALDRSNATAQTLLYSINQC